MPTTKRSRPRSPEATRGATAARCAIALCCVALGAAVGCAGAPPCSSAEGAAPGGPADGVQGARPADAEGPGRGGGAPETAREEGPPRAWPADGHARVAVPLGRSPARGAAAPLVTIVVFSDFECPYCAQAAPTLERLLETFPEEVRVVFRHNPLPFHDRASLAHQATLEARAQGGDEAFWRMHDLLFGDQGALEPPDLGARARSMELDLGRFAHALRDGRHLPAIEADRALAASLGARGVPTFFLNGRPLSGAQPFPVFEEIVDEEIALARRALRDGTPRSALYEAAQARATDGR